MSSETGRPRCYGQNFEGVAIPERGGEVSEEARLRLAPLGVYEVQLRQQPRYEFGGALFFDCAEPQPFGPEGPRQFDVVEDVAGIERTLMIQVVGNEIPFASLEIIPLDWDDRPVGFTRLGDGARHSTLRYRKDAPPESLKIRLSGISVFDVETVAGCLWAHGRPYPLDPLPAFIRRAEEIRVDLLRNPTGEARKLGEHLRALFETLAEEAPGRAHTVRCDFQYVPFPSVPAVSLPVSPEVSLNLPGDAATYSEHIAPVIGRCQSSAPAEGAFNFGVKVYGTKAPEPAPVLQYTQLLLPPGLIRDLE